MRKTKGVQKQDKTQSREDQRNRIIKAAITLLTEGGREVLTTRSVSEAADVQAPTLYRLFGDMRGLLDAVAEFGLVQAFKKKKEYKAGADAVEDLRKLWELHTHFGLQNPIIYTLIFGDPRPGFYSPAAQEAKRHLTELVQRIAVSGRLKVTEKRAAELVNAASSGAVLALLNTPEHRRDLTLAKDSCEAVIAAITNDAPVKNENSIRSASIALRAALPNLKSVTDGERHLLNELLAKIVHSE